MTNISVILCTHNPRPQYLKRTLQALQSQTFPLAQWELLVIDNASTPPLQDQWNLSWHSGGRIIRENKLGLTSARLRGIKESSGELMVFVDDDNVLDSDYLSTAHCLMSRHDHLDVIGAGRLEPEFEVPPSPELADKLSMLALRTVPTVTWSNNPNDSHCIPWGAGLCVRKDLATAYSEWVTNFFDETVLDRKGSQLFCGGDDLFSWAAAHRGKGFGVFPELRIVHLILAGRLTRGYFLRLIHDHSFSHSVLRYMLTHTKPRESEPKELIRMLLHGITHGAFSMQCRLAEVRGIKAAARFISEQNLRPAQ